MINVTNNSAELWCSVKEIKSSDRKPIFPKLANFMLNLLVLPHSSAAVERKFSQVRLIKTYHRNRLNTKTINGLLLIKGSGGSVSCYEWDPSSAMIKNAQTVFREK